MRSCLLVVLLLVSCMSARSEDNVSRVRKAVEQSTLDRTGTPPFHLKATLAPSFERDRDSNRNGTVEIWWVSPTQWKRDLAIPGFHLIEISDGTRHWQHTDGDYFPEWLREVATAVIQPIPDGDKRLADIKTAEIRTILGTTHFSWMEFSADGPTKKAMGAGITLNDNSGLLLYGSGFGWGFGSKDYAAFHKLLVARTISGGGFGPEVTAKINTLEDLGAAPAGLFDTTQPGNDANPLHTLVIDEASLRKNAEAIAAPVWPPLKDGPLEGVLTSGVVVDREGKVREIDTIISDNPGLGDAAREYIGSMHFRPYLLNGQPVQVVARLTFSFKTMRPAGVETFDSARNYFEHGRRLTSAAGGLNTTPYILRASFETGAKNGIGRGEYTDSWLSNTEWCREATLNQSHFSRCRDGDKWYLSAEGPESNLLQFVLKAVEPIPAIDTFVESDWRITGTTVDGVAFIRVATGHESNEGVLDAQSRGLWFDANGIPIRAHFRGLDTVQSRFEDFHGVKIPRQIDVLSNGKLGMRIQVNSIEQAGGLDPRKFKLSGHEWKRQFTDETR